MGGGGGSLVNAIEGIFRGRGVSQIRRVGEWGGGGGAISRGWHLCVFLIQWNEKWVVCICWVKNFALTPSDPGSHFYWSNMSPPHTSKSNATPS